MNEDLTIEDIFELVDLLYANKHMYEKLKNQDEKIKEKSE